MTPAGDAPVAAGAGRGAPAILVLERGRTFRGHAFGATPAEGSAGEVVFNTSMAGYQEILSRSRWLGSSHFVVAVKPSRSSKH